jgi:hypothetical protein
MMNIQISISLNCSLHTRNNPVFIQIFFKLVLFVKFPNHSCYGSNFHKL